MPLILGIETSCDETAAALVNGDRQILSNVIRSQWQEHAAYGGVVPEIASRAHMECVEQILTQALNDAGKTMEDVDAIAVTSGPGLIGGVIVGVMVAKTIASIHRKPFLAVNHLEAHALTARLTDNVSFPYLLLLVSGGHCLIAVVEDVGKYHLLGETRDDALGEAFDKTAKLMNLGYPGGPKIEAYAKQGDASRFPLPRPMIGQNHCDFSFSGLKTAVWHALEDLVAEQKTIHEQNKIDMAASFQAAIIDVLEDRLARAIGLAKQYYPIQSLVVAGGVAANQAIKARLTALCAQHQLACVVPPPKLCTDNAAMVAWAGLERFGLGQVDDLSTEPRARWPLVG